MSTNARASLADLRPKWLRLEEKAPIHGYGTLIDYTQKQLRSGLLQRISFVHKPEALPAATHERVTLNELLQAVHRQGDANSDGVVDVLDLLKVIDGWGLCD